MQKQISLTPEVETQLNRLRKKYANEERTPASYSRVIKRVMKKAKMWVEE